MTYLEKLEHWVAMLLPSDRQVFTKITVNHRFFKQLSHLNAYGAPIPKLSDSLASIRCEIVADQEVSWITYDQNGKEMERSSK